MCTLILLCCTGLIHFQGWPLYLIFFSVLFGLKEKVRFLLFHLFGFLTWMMQTWCCCYHTADSTAASAESAHGPLFDLSCQEKHRCTPKSYQRSSAPTTRVLAVKCLNKVQA